MNAGRSCGYTRCPVFAARVNRGPEVRRSSHSRSDPFSRLLGETLYEWELGRKDGDGQKRSGRKGLTADDAVTRMTGCDVGRMGDEPWAMGDGRWMDA